MENIITALKDAKLIFPMSPLRRKRYLKLCLVSSVRNASRKFAKRRVYNGLRVWMSTWCNERRICLAGFSKQEVVYAINIWIPIVQTNSPQTKVPQQNIVRSLKADCEDKMDWLFKSIFIAIKLDIMNDAITECIIMKYVISVSATTGYFFKSFIISVISARTIMVFL